MSRFALTDAWLRKVKGDGNRHEVSDATTTGLRARISKDGKITFILKARSPANELKTVTLGDYPTLSLKAAREKATAERLALKAGKDVNAEKRKIRQAAGSTSGPTLGALVQEYEKRFGSAKKTWQPRGPRSLRSAARQVIERVYADLLHRDVKDITEDEFADCTNHYQAVKPRNGKKTANGQASKARAYLGPVLDWAAGREKFSKIGAARTPRLDVASVKNIHDPATTDPSITGKRKRVLSEAELHSILPLLTYPAPSLGKLRLTPESDYRPLAMRFVLFTAARLDEVCSMRWREFDRNNGVWHKPSVKSTRGGPRAQDLPLSGAAIEILRRLPGWHTAQGGELVFPNSTGKTKLGNWTRFQSALEEVSGTSGWHRHDLRRTAATIMLSLKVPVSTIEQILAHTDPFKGENAGGSASNYLQIARVLQNARDPQEEALATLAEALALIEGKPCSDRD